MVLIPYQTVRLLVGGTGATSAVVSWQWGGSACVLPCHLAHPSAATNHIGHSVAATLLGSIGTDMCGLRSPHKYRCCRGILIRFLGCVVPLCLLLCTFFGIEVFWTNCGRLVRFRDLENSELSSHQMSVRALVRQEGQDFPASRSPFEVISVCSLLTRTHSLKGRVSLQLQGCPMEYIFKFTHYAIGGVAVQYLHPQGTPPLQLGGCTGLWLPPTPCRGAPTSLATSSWYGHYTRAMV